MSIAKHLAAAALAVGAMLPMAASAGHLTTIHTFEKPKTGKFPQQAALIYQNGMLYGGTGTGGELLHGLVFSLDPVSSAYSIIYEFGQSENPSQSVPAMLYYDGNLFGSLRMGGVPRAGEIFEVNLAAGTEAAIYTFKASKKAKLAGPGAMTLGGDRLFGITNSYDNAYGSLFRIDSQGGPLRRVYDFTPGAGPQAPLVREGGTFYGTTCCDGASGYGTVYKFDSVTKTKTVLYSFPAEAGLSPDGGLTYAKGMLYGIAIDAAAGCSGGGSCGTIYQVDPATGAETDLYNFVPGGASGALPNSPLLYHDGFLYGSAYEGGNQAGYGTIFKVDAATGAITTLHQFKGGKEGINPSAPLIFANGAYYGTTVIGGRGKCFDSNGCGTVFEYAP